MFTETYSQNHIFCGLYAIKPKLTYDINILIFLLKPKLTWQQALFAETYSQNYIFGRAYAIKPNLTYQYTHLPIQT